MLYVLLPTALFFLSTGLHLTETLKNLCLVMPPYFPDVSGHFGLASLGFFFFFK